MSNRSGFNRGDRVRLTAKAAAEFAQLAGKVGVVKHQPRGGMVGILWEGSRTADYWPAHRLSKAPATPPPTEAP